MVWIDHTPPDLNAVAYTGRSFVAVGGGGTILYATNGPLWIRLDSGVTDDLLSVEHHTNLFVATGADGVILTSSNGISWISQRVGAVLYASAFGNGRFVAVGWNNNSGVILTSTNGRDWEAVASETNSVLRGVTFANQRFVAVGDRGNPGALYPKPGAGPISLVSNDGIEWSLHEIGLNWTEADQSSRERLGLHSVTYGQNRFVAVGSVGVTYAPDRPIVYSSDGMEWTRAPVAAGEGPARARRAHVPRFYALKKVHFNGRSFVAVGYDFESNQDMIWRSDDGVSWIATWFARIPLKGIAFGNNTFVVVGDRQMTLISSNAVDWKREQPVTGEEIGDLTFGLGRFVAVTRGHRSRHGSPYAEWGEAWFSADSMEISLSGEITTNALHALVSVPGQVIAVGSRGTIVRTADLKNWSAQVSGTTNALRATVATDSEIMTVGDHGTIIASPDGRTWQGRYSQANLDLTQVAYGNGMWLASAPQYSSSSGTSILLVSTNGHEWTQRTYTYGDIYELIFAAGKFVAGGYRGLTISSDAETWQRVAPTNFHALDLTWGNGKFLVLGHNDWAQRLILSSRDAVSWTVEYAGTDALLELAFGDGRFVALGEWGKLLTAEVDSQIRPEFRTLRWAAERALQVTVHGVSSTSISLESSTNLMQWATVTNLTTIPTPLLLPFNSSSPMMLFRIRVDY